MKVPVNNLQTEKLTLAQAAKMTGYHQDYLGQLCRSGKIVAEKHGRIWYTSEPAVRDYFDSLNQIPELKAEPITASNISEVAAVSPSVPTTTTAEVIPQVAGLPIRLQPKKTELAPKVVLVKSAAASVDAMLAALKSRVAVLNVAIVVLAIAVTGSVGMVRNSILGTPEIAQTEESIAQKVPTVPDATPTVAGSVAAESNGFPTPSPVQPGNDSPSSVAEVRIIQPQVLGNTIVVQSAQQPITEISEQYIDQLILFNLEQAIAFGWLKGEKGDRGPRGSSGRDGTSYGADEATPLVGASLDISGNGQIDGTLAVNGGITGTINPSFTTGSIIFQGPSGIAQDNSSLYFDDTKNALGLGTTSIANSAVVELSSTTKGFLPPRMTTLQRDGIASPAEGLIVYNTSDGELNIYAGGAWTSVGNVGGMSSDWDDLNNPSANLALSMQGYSTTFTFGNATAAANLFNLTDTAANTGTGYLLSVGTAAGSILRPLNISVNGGATTALAIDASGNSSFGGEVAFGSTTTFQNNDITDNEVSNTLTSSIFVGPGSTTNAIDLGTAEVAGILGAANGGTGATTAADARTNLGVAIGTDVQAYNANLTTYAGIAPSINVQTLLGAADYTAFKTSLSLHNVENTALSTWTGSANIATLGTITSGTWQGTEMGLLYGGTGATNAAGARTNLGLAIGTNVQAYDANLTAWAGKTVPSGTVIGSTDAQALANKDLTSGTNTFPTFNQNTTGSAATLTTARSIYGNNFDGSADLAQIIAPTFGGTGNGFTAFTGPATSTKTFTLPNSSAIILTDATAVTATQGGTGLTGYALGDLLYASGVNNLAKLPGNSTTSRMFLRQTGNGSASSAPAWDTLTSADVGLANVENTALSTWTGSLNIATLGTVTSGVWNGTPLTDAYVSDTLTASSFIGSGSTTTAVDLGTVEVAGTLAVANGGTGAVSLNDLISLGTHSTGNYVATISAGSGISGSAGSEGATPTISLGSLTADWNQAGTFDISLDNAASEIKMLESVGGTYYGTIDVGDLAADATFTLSGASGTLLTSANYSSTLHSIYLQSANNLSDIADAASARGNLGLGTLAIQNANSVAITGGSISGITDLSVADGGTGVSTLAANGILFGNGASAIGVTSSAANSVLATDGLSVPSLTQTLPLAVQGNINSLGTITAGVWNGTALTDAYISDTLTSSLFIGAGSSTTAVDLATSEVAGTLTVGRGGTNISSYTAGDLLYATGSTTLATLGIGGDGQCLVVAFSLPTWGTCSGGSGDSVTVNNIAAGDANFINTAASGTVASVTWSLNTTPSPDEISIAIGAASATEAGIVTTGTQTFAGGKTFNGTVAFGSTTTFQSDDIIDSEVSNTLTSSLFVGSGSTTNAIDLGTAEVAGILGAANGGTGAATLTGMLIGNGTSAVSGTTTSSGISGAITDEQGSGALVFATSPTLTTPVLGVATATSINKLTITAPATSATLTITDGKTLTANNSLTFAGNDSTTITFQGTDTYVGRATTDTLTNKTLTDATVLFGDDADATKKLALQLSGITAGATRTLTIPDASGTIALTSNNLSAFEATTSAQLAIVISDETGSGSLVFSTSPTLTTPILGAASATTLSLTGGQSADIFTPAAATATALVFQPGTSSGASSNGPLFTLKGGNASGTTSVTGGGLTLQGGNATGASGTRNGGAVNIDGGTGATANGAVNIGTTVAGSINIGTASTAKTITIGSTAGDIIAIGSGATTGKTITIGSGAVNNTITIGSSSAQNVSITDNNWSVTTAGVATFVGVNSGTGLVQGTGGLTITGTTSINNNTNSATNINTGSSNALVTIGGGSGTFSLQTSNIDISSTGAITNATGFNGLVVTANTGVITTGTWNGTAIGAQYGGTGINTSASTGVPTISSGTWSVASSLGVALGGTGAATLASNGVLYGNGTSAIQATAQGGANTVLVANGGAPSFSAAITVGTSVTSPTINATTSLQLNGTSINTAGTLTNVAYLDQNNTFTGRNIFNPTVTANGGIGLSVTPTITNATGSATQYGQKLTVTSTGSTAATLYGQHISLADSTSTANTTYGLYVDGSTSNASDTNYTAVFQGGNVGIGTTTPAEVLHIRGGNVTGLRVESTSNAAVVDLYGSCNITTNRNWRIANNYALSGSLNLLSSSSCSGEPTGTHFTFNPNGRFGIGTADPQMPLDVAGDTRVNSLSLFSVGGGTYGGNLTWGGTNSVILGTGQAGSGSTNGQIFIRPNGDQSSTGQVYINTTGVGIGTTFPQTTFQVGAKVNDDASYSYDINSLSDLNHCT